MAACKSPNKEKSEMLIGGRGNIKFIDFRFESW